MQISYEKPPCFDEANAFFKLEELNLGTVMTYGDTMYNPFGAPLSQDLLAHEEIHTKQHQHNDTVAKLWWQKYIADPTFRLEQELEAYGAQYAFLCTQEKDKNERTRILYKLSSALSSAMYGSIITPSQARIKIKEAAKSI